MTADADTDTASRANRSAVAASYVFGLVTAAVLGHFLLQIPIQVSDSFGNMLQLQTSWPELLAGQFYQQSYLRPLLWTELKLAFDASQGNYVEWFRAIHVAQVVALVLLFLALVRPRTWRDAAVVPLGLAALLGSHTFRGTVVEAFPINTFLTILLCCLAAANLAVMTHRWWVDVAALVLFVVSALTVESGLLVWVIVVGAALVGARGVSRNGLGGLTVLMAGYFVLRFSILDVGSPGLIERSSGFGFRVLDPPDLVAQFGGSPLVFYAYNVVTSVLSVLFSEPRAGVFLLTQSVVTGELSSGLVVAAVASVLGTVVIGALVWQRRREWLAFRFERDDVIVAMFLMVLAANAVISFPYTKDVIMSPAGVFYAAALFVAVRRAAATWFVRDGLLPRVATSAFCMVLGTGWAIREVGTHLDLSVAAFQTRNDWAYAHEWVEEQGMVLRPQDERIFQYLQNDAIMRRGPAPLWPANLKLFDVE